MLSTTDKITGKLSTTQKLTGKLSVEESVTGKLSIPDSRTVSADYNTIKNKPSINGMTITGDKSGDDYNLQGKMESVSMQDIDKIIYGG